LIHFVEDPAFERREGLSRGNASEEEGEKHSHNDFGVSNPLNRSTGLMDPPPDARRVNWSNNGHIPKQKLGTE
jgi:hypothetical protein